MARLISLPIALLALCGCGSVSDDKAEDTAPGGETTTATQTNGTSTVTGTHTTTTTTITDTTPSDAVVLGDWTLTPNENVGSILVLAWEQGKAGDVWAEYSFDEDVWMSTPVMSAGAGSHELPLLGIPSRPRRMFASGAAPKARSPSPSRPRRPPATSLPDSSTTPCSRVTTRPSMMPHHGS